tara:strand:- start:2297 stop:3121 length:825 start_codon:yes stop_codon:yes gene_type:complete
MKTKINFIREKSNWLRYEIVKMVLPAGQGHIASAMSQVEICTTLFYGGFLKYKKNNPNYKDRDYFMISKGHSAMGAYPILSDIGYFKKKELEKYGKPNGILRIYGDKSIPGVECSTGSLSQAPGIAAGICYHNKLKKKNNKCYVIISDGENYEGSIWETAMFASNYNLDNLIIIIDRNKQIILGKTENLMKLEPLGKKWASFGWDVQNVNGHSIKDLQSCFKKVNKKNGKPKLIIANTIKGKGISFMEDVTRWHNSFPNTYEAKQALKEVENET